MAFRRMIVLAAAAAALWVVPTPSGSQTPQPLDYGVFKSSIQPIFITRRPGHTRCVVCHAGANNSFRLERLQ